MEEKKVIINECNKQSSKNQKYFDCTTTKETEDQTQKL